MCSVSGLLNVSRSRHPVPLFKAENIRMLAQKDVLSLWFLVKHYRVAGRWYWSSQLGLVTVGSSAGAIAPCSLAIEKEDKSLTQNNKLNKSEGKQSTPRSKLTYTALLRSFYRNESFLDTVMEWVAKRLLKRIDKAIAKSSTPLMGLEAVFMANIEFVTSYPELPRLLLSELQKQQHTVAKKMAKKLLSHYSTRLHALFCDAKVQGELPSDLDVDTAVTTFVGSIQGLVVQSLLLDDPDFIRREALNVFQSVVVCTAIKSKESMPRSKPLLTTEEYSYILSLAAKQESL